MINFVFIQTKFYKTCKFVLKFFLEEIIAVFDEGKPFVPQKT